MKRSTAIQVLAILAVVASRQGAHAGVLLVDHQPHPYGGFASDTLFITSLGQTVWQRVADDFTLNQPALVTSFTAWGFYERDIAPTSETMRVRFYAARPGDGLPDESNILYEETFSNLSRTATGRHILVDYYPREFLYDAELAAPVSFDAQTKYWFEFVQLGDIGTHFRWESSTAELNDSAAINYFYPSWHYGEGTRVDEAFRLIGVPEPSTAAWFFSAMFLMSTRKLWGDRRQRCKQHV